MSEKERGIIIIGGSDQSGLAAMRIAEIKAMHPTAEVFTLEEAKERGLTESYEYKARPPIPELTIPTFIDGSFGDGKSARNIRRAEERKSRKKNK